MRVLLSNDDGVDAQGLVCLQQVMATLGEVVVMAPDRDRSGSSHALTLDNPLRVKELAENTYSVAGTPTDCVHIALTGFLEQEPDLVISGINLGANMGDDVLYSGTVAAAMEGHNVGLPAMAFSLAGHEYFETAAEIAKRLVVRWQAQRLPVSMLLNVNVPDRPLAEIRGFQITRLGNRHRAEHVHRSCDPRGREIFWVGAAGAEQDAGEGTDFNAVKESYVSVTPLQLDMTYYSAFEPIADWLSVVT